MSTDTGRQYFPYIDGLRAVSIIAVVLFHLEPKLLPGGFGGVDIFFVVSGFIVSGSLHGHKATGFWALVALFYARRLRRIAPALLFMLVTTSLAVVVFIPDAFQTRYTAIAAFFGLANFQLARGPDYFSLQAEFNPFTHTWSLGVEEQFYLIFPLLIFLLTSGDRRARATRIGLAAVCVLSFVYGFFEPPMAFPLGFYSSISRFWEIGTGVLLYAILARHGRFERRKVSPSEIQIATYFGSALIAAGLLIGNAQAYPVPGALLPVAGALLLIAGLHGRAPLSLIAKLLGSGPAVSIGLISYSLYLWHWPVFVMFRWTSGFNSPAQKAAALAIALAMALISYLLVEKPLRMSLRLRAPLQTIGVYMLAVVVLAVATDRMLGNSWLFSASTVVSNRLDWYPGDEMRLANRTGCRVVWDKKRLKVGVADVSRRVDCDLPDASNKVFVIGDSHARAYSTLLADFARVTRVPVLLEQNPGCYFVHLEPASAHCAAIANAALDAIRQELKAGDVIFMPSLRLPHLRGQWADRDFDTVAEWRRIMQGSENGFAEALAIFEKLNVPGVHFVFELPKPIFSTPLYRCSDWFNRNNPGCGAGTEKDRTVLEQYRQPVVAFAERLQGRIAGFTTWDPFPVLCPGATCSMRKDGKPLFFDGDHLSGFANRLLLADFIRKMNELGVLPR